MPREEEPTTRLPTPLGTTLARRFDPVPHSYTERDASLYALAVGAAAADGAPPSSSSPSSPSPSSSPSNSNPSELALVYDGAAGFAPLPTFPCTFPYFGVTAAVPFEEILPNFNPVSFMIFFLFLGRRARCLPLSPHPPLSHSLSLPIFTPTETKLAPHAQMGVLHGEQFISIPRPLPPAAEVETEPRVLSVSDKGKAAVVVLSATTRDRSRHRKRPVLCYQELTVFVRGAGGFGGEGGVDERQAPSPFVSSSPRGGDGGQRPSLAPARRRLRAAPAAKRRGALPPDGGREPPARGPGVCRDGGLRVSFFYFLSFFFFFPHHFFHLTFSLSLSQKKNPKFKSSDPPRPLHPRLRRPRRHQLHEGRGLGRRQPGQDGQGQDELARLPRRDAADRDVAAAPGRGRRPLLQLLPLLLGLAALSPSKRKKNYRKVVFVTSVVERGTRAITGAAVELGEPGGGGGGGGGRG